MTTSQAGCVRWISLGRGRTSATASRSGFEATPGYLGHLEEHVGREAWWSPHIWAGNRRRSDAWEGASAIAADLDHYDEAGKHAPPPDDRRAVVVDAVLALGATAVHHTPRGLRAVWVLDEQCSNREAWLAAAQALCDRLESSLKNTGFRVDRGATLDLARLFWTPGATVDGAARNAEVRSLGEVVHLQDLLPDRRDAGDDTLRIAVAAYRHATPLDIPRYGGECPLCRHNGCFGQLPTDPLRWFCFSDRHEADSGGVGVRGARGWHGDVLDIHAHAGGCSRMDVLRRAGLWGQRKNGGKANGSPAPSVGSGTTPRGGAADSTGSANTASAPSVSSVGGSRGSSPEFRPLRPLPDPLTAVPAFDPILLPASFRGWVEDIANRIQCPIDFPAVAAMVSYSSLVGRRVGIRPKQQDDWLVVPNLWGGPVGRPGVMKTPGLQEPMSFLRRIEASARQDYDAAVVEYEAQQLVARAQDRAIDRELQRAIRDGADAMAIARRAVAAGCDEPTRKRYVTNDVTVEKLGELLQHNPMGVLIFRDELTGLLRSLDKEGHEGARAFYLEAWNGTGPFTFDRIGRGTVEIPAAICSILGGIQPGPLAGYLKSAMRAGAGDDGLLQRFQLLVYPDVSATWKNVDQWPSTAARQAAWEAYAAVPLLDPHQRRAKSDADGDIPFLRFTPEAQEAFNAWRADLERVVRSATEHPAIEAHLSKYRSLIPSLSLLAHVAEGGIGPVALDCVERAIGWANYLEPHARRIYGLTLGNHVESRAIAKHILNRDLEDGFDARRVYRAGWSNLDDPVAVEAGLEELIQFGWLAEETRPTAGRRATVYRINPKIWELAPGGADRTDRRRGPAPSGESENSSSGPQGTDRTDRSPAASTDGVAENAGRPSQAADRTDRSRAGAAGGIEPPVADAQAFGGDE